MRSALRTMLSILSSKNRGGCSIARYHHSQRLTKSIKIGYLCPCISVWRIRPRTERQNRLMDCTLLQVIQLRQLNTWKLCAADALVNISTRARHRRARSTILIKWFDCNWINTNSDLKSRNSIGQKTSEESCKKNSLTSKNPASVLCCWALHPCPDDVS